MTDVLAVIYTLLLIQLCICYTEQHTVRSHLQVVDFRNLFYSPNLSCLWVRYLHLYFRDKNWRNRLKVALNSLFGQTLSYQWKKNLNRNHSQLSASQSCFCESWLELNVGVLWGKLGSINCHWWWLWNELHCCKWIISCFQNNISPASEWTQMFHFFPLQTTVLNSKAA